MAQREWGKRYAQAIFEIAMDCKESQKEKALDTWTRDLDALNKALSEAEFKMFLEHAKVPMSRKVKMLKQAMPDLNPLARNLAAAMVSKGLVDHLPRVRVEFNNLVDRHRGVERVKVTSAVELTKGQKDKIAQFVQEMTGKKVVLETRVDLSILGGLIIRVGDKLMDGSTRTKLQDLEEELAVTAIPVAV